MSRVRDAAVAVVCLSALIVSPMYAANPTPIHNSVKYKDAGARPATGRSGSAAIQVRALRGQANTDIEVTTGQFESAAPAAGKLDKVQVKVFGTDGNLIVTDNYRKGSISGGYGSFAYAWPLRGQGVQVQANVSGIDPNRTDVVTVASSVKWRPDLTVASIQAPNRALIGSVVTIEAVVREGNGDVGARANCVLKADGIVVDHADGIWVDAGDAVTCEFRHAFATLGQKQLTVEVTNVAPGDFNTANNTRTATLEIVPASSPLWYNMNAEDTMFYQTAPSRSHEEFTSVNPDFQSYVRDVTGGSTSTTHLASYGSNLLILEPVEFPVALESRLIVDGQPLLQSSFTVEENPNSFMGFSGDGYWNRCGDQFDGYHWFFVCHFHSEFDGVVVDRTTAYSSGQAGLVTYNGYGTSQTRYENGVVDVYTYNDTYDYLTAEVLSPMPATLGNNVVVHASFTDAGNKHFEADASVDLLPVEDVTYDYGDYCYNYDYTVENYGRINGYQCVWPVTLQQGKAGWHDGQAQ